MDDVVLYGLVAKKQFQVGLEDCWLKFLVSADYNNRTQQVSMFPITPVVVFGLNLVNWLGYRNCHPGSIYASGVMTGINQTIPASIEPVG